MGIMTMFCMTSPLLFFIGCIVGYALSTSSYIGIKSEENSNGE